MQAQAAEILELKQKLAVYHEHCVCFDNGTDAFSQAA
jgi:hypothetical protein